MVRFFYQRTFFFFKVLNKIGEKCFGGKPLPFVEVLITKN